MNTVNRTSKLFALFAIVAVAVFAYSASAASCGNGQCENIIPMVICEGENCPVPESYENCPQDCPVPASVTCSNGLRDSNEAGIDCGGSCANNAGEVCDGKDNDKDCLIDEGCKSIPPANGRSGSGSAGGKATTPVAASYVPSPAKGKTESNYSVQATSAQPIKANSPTVTAAATTGQKYTAEQLREMGIGLPQEGVTPASASPNSVLASTEGQSEITGIASTNPLEKDVQANKASIPGNNQMTTEAVTPVAKQSAPLATAESDSKESNSEPAQPAKKKKSFFARILELFKR